VAKRKTKKVCIEVFDRTNLAKLSQFYYFDENGPIAIVKAKSISIKLNYSSYAQDSKRI
jgi:hypothetical protein